MFLGDSILQSSFSLVYNSVYPRFIVGNAHFLSVVRRMRRRCVSAKTVEIVQAANVSFIHHTKLEVQNGYFEYKW
jgi:hypothetical protein